MEFFRRKASENPGNTLFRFSLGQALFDDFLGDRRIGVKKGHQALVNNRGNDALNLGVDQLDLGLGFKPRIWQLDAQHADQSLPHVIPRERRILVLEKFVGFGVLVLGQASLRAKGERSMKPPLKLRCGDGAALRGVCL